MANAEKPEEPDLPNQQSVDEQSVQAEAEVIDAEIIEEAPSPKAEPLKNSNPVHATPQKTSGKAGWVMAGLLAAFVGGLFAAPYAEKQLIALGLLGAETQQTAQNIQAFDSTALEAEVASLKASLVTYKEALSQQAEDIIAANTARADLQRQLELAAAANVSTLDNGASTAQIASLKADIERLTADLARLSALNSEANPEVSQLKGALALAKAENTQFKARLDLMETNLNAVKAGALEASPRGRLVLALVSLKERALAGLDFSAELNALRTDIADLPAIDQQLMGAEFARLEPHTPGISPYISLVRDYDAAVSGALAAGEKADGSFLSSLFTSRRTDAGASGDDAVFLQAERRLAARDTAGAIETLGGLTPVVAEAMKAWTDRAQAYVDTQTALNRMIKAATNAGTPKKAGE